MKQPIVVPRRGAVAAAMDAADLSLRDLETASSVSRSTLSNLSRDIGGVAKDKACRIADALDVSVGALFVHRDGAPLAGA